MALFATRFDDIVVYNRSPSLPVGLYWRVAGPPRYGDFVTVRAIDAAPSYAAKRHFSGPRDRFIKRVAATRGQVACAEGDGIAIDGRLIARRRERDRTGAALPRWTGCRTLAAGEVLLLGDTPDSFDGRYWGPIDAEKIEGVWRRF